MFEEGNFFPSVVRHSHGYKNNLLLFFKFIYHLPITISFCVCSDIKQDLFPLNYALHIRSQPPVTKPFQTLYCSISCIFIEHYSYFHSSSIFLNVSFTLSSLNFYCKVLNMLLMLLSTRSHQLKKLVSNQSPYSTDRMCNMSHWTPFSALCFTYYLHL